MIGKMKWDVVCVLILPIRICSVFCVLLFLYVLFMCSPFYGHVRFGTIVSQIRYFAGIGAILSHSSLFWGTSITYDNVFLLERRGNHMLKKFRGRRGCRVPSQLTWPVTKICDGTGKFVSTLSVDGRCVLPETHFVGTLRVDTTHILSVGGFLPAMVAAEERPEFDIEPPFGAPLLIFY